MSAPSAIPSTSPAERRATQSLSAALLLTFAGGFLDAFLYLAHGRVFAGAMTGNAVFAGIALVSRDPRAVAQHMLPIVAFAAGIWCAFAAEARLRHHVVLVALVLEAIGLFMASLLPRSFPDMLFVSLICAVAGYQVGSFRKVDSFVYNATFIAGNLLRTAESLHAALLGVQPRRSKREYRDLGLVLVLFVAGATTAAMITGHMGNHALWVPTAAVLIVLSIAIWGDLRHPEPSERRVGEPK